MQRQTAIPELRPLYVLPFYPYRFHSNKQKKKKKAPIDSTSLKDFAATEFKTIFSGIQPRQDVILTRLYAGEISMNSTDKVRLNSTAETNK